MLMVLYLHITIHKFRKLMMFSCLLGESAAGITFWIGYSDKAGGAYQDSSFFAKYEFPKLTPDRVKRLVIIDIYI